ncbi:hypothetical protein CC1G_00168 [Coprinopsis cinerea okayama7|uniref:Uncharacterized protein n=1 Tax=Coprinopsis cinerea (strain Okayama-7 / 130 / ATCC MYA-4618 / FGSC 9003) TaxID=240176 RepID=A8NX05_COPC7|nr:hypothetical protein CC1G_00168 [Coprinopsis cinerea okayama7\|eukprot:XP_001837032.2 hypothetical protein CC1G_00168 [Coprinopsis cinerea okayama7\
MDDDITWGSSVWASEDPIAIDAPGTKPRPPSIEVPPPPTPFGDDAGFDDFDDFAAADANAQDDGMKDDDFGDFEDFEEGGAQTVSAFVDVDSFPEAGPSRQWQPLQLDPLPPRQELRDEINDILAPIWEGEDIRRITTDDPMREVEGIGQILITSSSRETYKGLLQTTPPTKPTNWTRSRIRRQHLISLGIPVNLDEVLPKATGKPLPPLEIHTRPMSAPPGGRPQPHGGSSHPSRSGTPQPGPKNRIVAQFGPKPEIDTARINKLLDTDPEWLKMQPLHNLERMLSELKMQTASVSSLLTYLLQSRDALQQDSETYNGLIAELVSEVAQKVKSGKPGLTRTISLSARGR